MASVSQVLRTQAEHGECESCGEWRNLDTHDPEWCAAEVARDIAREAEDRAFEAWREERRGV